MIPDWLIPAPADRAELGRLEEFRAEHPEVVIGDGGFGTWQALIPLPTGELVVTRHLLRYLLDALEEIFPPGPEARPGGNKPGPDG